MVTMIWREVGMSNYKEINPVEFITNFKIGKDAMIIKLKNVRLAFSDLFKPTAFEDGQELKYGATFLIGKKDPQISKEVLLGDGEVLKGGIEQAILEVAKAQWKDKGAAVIASIRDNPNKFCFQDGDLKPYDGFQNCMALTSKNKKRPRVVDADRTPLTQEDGKPYPGCYVMGSVEIWAQDNKWGKAIRASLRGVQFYKDGDAFTAGSVASEDEFDDLGDGADFEDDLA